MMRTMRTMMSSSRNSRTIRLSQQRLHLLPPCPVSRSHQQPPRLSQIRMIPRPSLPALAILFQSLHGRTSRRSRRCPPADSTPRRLQRRMFQLECLARPSVLVRPLFTLPIPPSPPSPPIRTPSSPSPARPGRRRAARPLSSRLRVRLRCEERPGGWGIRAGRRWICRMCWRTSASRG